MFLGPGGPAGLGVNRIKAGSPPALINQEQQLPHSTRLWRREELDEPDPRGPPPGSGPGSAAPLRATQETTTRL